MTVNAFRVGATALLLTATVAASKFVQEYSPDRLAQPLDSIPSSLDGWAGKNLPPLTDHLENVLGATSYIGRLYQRRDQSLNLLVTYYGEQRNGKWMHSPKDCLPGAGWELVEGHTVPVKTANGTADVNLYLVRKFGETAHVVYWYQSRSGVFADENVRKAFMLMDLLREKRAGGALVRLVAPDPSVPVSEELKFASALIPEVERCLSR